jgi:phosphoserine phosphatase RsbU/P
MIHISDIVLLFVDDEADILSSLNRLLRKEPYKKLFASTAVQALELLESNNVAIVLSDFKMPDMNGLELVKRVKMRYPDIITIIISGDNNVEQIIESDDVCDIFRVIPKPVEPVALKKIINEAIHHYCSELGDV